jgi:hypothetical protein
VTLKPLVLDACVLIDYLDEDAELLRMITEHLHEVIVPRPVLTQVTNLTEKGAIALGLQVFVPTEIQFQEASIRRGRLSFEDHLCLVIARDVGAPCATSDVHLIKACRAANLEHREAWAPLLDLVKLGEIGEDRCHDAVRSMRDRNGAYITTAVFQVFEKRLRSAARRGRRRSGEAEGL